MSGEMAKNYVRACGIDSFLKACRTRLSASVSEKWLLFVGDGDVFLK